MSSNLVLIVDDNRDLAENIAEILSSSDTLKIDCRVCGDAKTALREAEQSDVDLALVDLHLPDGDGFELISGLRERSPFAQVVIVTGDTTLESAIEAVRQDAFGYVLKPFHGVDLIGTVERAIKQSSLERESEELRRALEASEDRHRQVVENMPAFVLALDHRGQILLWNRRLEEVSGYPHSEMLGTSGRDLIGETGGERRLPIKSGGHRLVRWVLQQVPDGEENEVETYAMGVDVSVEYERLRDKLRTERLAAVGTLAAGLAHEVRNPLNSATLQLQVLDRRIDKGQTDAESLKSVTRTVREEIARLDNLVSDFLAFARPRTLELRSEALNDLLTSSCELVAPEASAAGVDIVRDFDDAVGNVRLDSERLKQVLLNLFRNALEAMPDGGTLTVSSRRADSAGFASIEVGDTGQGFEDDAPIFDAFFTSKEGGTGLGLAIVHRIVSEHGGMVTAESAPGRTVLQVRLPQPRSA